MKLFLSIYLLSFTVYTFCQSKDELLSSIIKNNSFDSQHIGAAGVESKQYSDFKKLQHMLSEKELKVLTKHKNAVIRMYTVSALIENGDDDILDYFTYEAKKDEMVETFTGCIKNRDKCSSIVYHAYWNKIRMDTLQYYNEYDTPDVKKAEAAKLLDDVKMQKLDSLVLYSEGNIDWLIYTTAFENREYKTAYLPRLKVLAFDRNNGEAFNYLIKHYHDELKTAIESYLNNEFLNHQFEDDDIFDLVEILNAMLATNNLEYRNIAIQKLRSDKSWHRHKAWINNAIINEYKLKI